MKGGYEIISLNNSKVEPSSANGTCIDGYCPDGFCPSIDVICCENILCSCPPPEDIYCGAIWHGCATGMR